MPTDAAATEGWRPPGEPAHPHWSGLPRWARVLLGLGLRAWSLSPWVVLAYAGAAVGLHRWPGLPGQAGAGLCVLAGAAGWRLLWRAAVAEVDLAVAATIRSAGVADPAPWALFSQREELIKAAHWRACLARHGVNPRSSGWERLVGQTPRRGRAALALALLACAPLAVAPWWLF